MSTLGVDTGDVAPWIERMARVGYGAKAVLYGTIGLLAVAAALGAGGGTTDTRGAMAEVLKAPFGRMLLVIVALGLLGYAVWRVVEAIADPARRGSDAKGLLLRASFFARGLLHAGLAVSAVGLAMGHGSSRGSSGGNTQAMTSKAMSSPGPGVLLVWAVAVGIAAFGVYQLYRAVTAKLSKQLDLGAAGDSRDWIVMMSRFGIFARGVVFIAIGWLMGRAAATHDASRAGGVGGALKELEHLGRWPFAAIALGLVAYGGYQLVNARYRRITAS